MKLLIFRTLLIYLCVLFAMRLMGKRQLGELQPEELVSTILISNLASISIESEEVPVTASLIPLFLIKEGEKYGYPENPLPHRGFGAAGVGTELPQPEIFQHDVGPPQDGHSGRTNRPERSAHPPADDC